jgi:hypothetical protein
VNSRRESSGLQQVVAGPVVVSVSDVLPTQRFINTTTFNTPDGLTDIFDVMISHEELRLRCLQRGSVEENYELNFADSGQSYAEVVSYLGESSVCEHLHGIWGSEFSQEYGVVKIRIRAEHISSVGVGDIVLVDTTTNEIMHIYAATVSRALRSYSYLGSHVRVGETGWSGQKTWTTAAAAVAVAVAVAVAKPRISA